MFGTKINNKFTHKQMYNDCNKTFIIQTFKLINMVDIMDEIYKCNGGINWRNLIALEWWGRTFSSLFKHPSILLPMCIFESVDKMNVETASAPLKNRFWFIYEELCDLIKHAFNFMWTNNYWDVCKEITYNYITHVYVSVRILIKWEKFSKLL